MRCLRATMVVRLGEGMSRWRSGREALNLTVRWRDGENGLFNDEAVFTRGTGGLEARLEGELFALSSLMVGFQVAPRDHRYGGFLCERKPTVYTGSLDSCCAR